MLSVGLIDKYPVIATGLGVILGDKFGEVAIHTRSNFDGFYQAFKNETLHIIILTAYGDSIEDTLQIAGKCKRQFPSVPFIIFGEAMTVNDVVRVLKVGAKAYLPKRDPLEEILNCFDAVMKGRHYVNSMIGEQMLSQSFVADEPEVSKLSTLTEKQSNIAKHLSKGLGTSTIATILNLKPSTVSTVKGIIFRKMNVNNVIELSYVFKTQMS